MSHEIRTPLTAIVGYAELLVRPRRDSVDRDAWIKGLRRGSNHLLSLVDDILDLSKIEAGKMRVSKAPQSPVQIVRQVIQLMRPQAREKMLNLSFELTGKLPREIDTDEVRLRQILVNLVSNAIKFTDSGGVTIKMRVRRLSAESAVLEISVEDTGIGIPEEKLSAVFAPFTQVAEGTREGTGLGLDISIRMAQLLGGELAVQSTEGKGSTFFLRLNLGPMAALDLADPSELNRHPEQLLFDQNSTVEDIRFDGYRVLVVEDGRDNQAILRFLLEEAGAKVGIAEDGREAVDEISAAGKDYDLVLMDVQMPVMDGYEATAKLRQIGFEAPIIAVTAYALPRDLERVLAAGCNDFVTKPLIPADLLRKVESWLSPREASVVHEASDRPSRLTENERFLPLLRKFLAGLADRITAIESAQAEGDEAALLSLVHQLKGSAGSYGYPHLSDLARDCQDLLRSEGGQERLRPRLASLLEELQRLREEAEVLDPRV
ncbi:MAG: ATP-binding protein [Myxococcota bacterium]